MMMKIKATDVTQAEGSEIGDFLSNFLAMGEDARHAFLKTVFNNFSPALVRHGAIDFEANKFLSASDTQRLDYIRQSL